MDVEIPANTSAKIYIPATNSPAILEIGRSLSNVKEIRSLGKEGSYTIVEVGSGVYHFNNKE